MPYHSQNACYAFVLGDINYNVLDLPESIVSLMSTHGYAQLVNNPTTAKGTLIDHVYSNLHDNIIVEVYDTYYSDHDTVYCSILM